MFKEYIHFKNVKADVRAIIGSINAQNIRQDIANAGYMKSDGSINSPEGNFDGIKDIPKEIGALSGVRDGTQTFYAFLVQRITELKQKKLNDPLFDKYSYEFNSLESLNIHLVRSLLYKYQTSNDNKAFNLENELPSLDSIMNPGSDAAKILTVKDSFFDDSAGFDKLITHLINKLVAKEAIDRVNDLSSGSIQQPDPFYYEQARKVLNGGNASYQGPSSDGGDDFSLTNLAGYQNIQYIGAGLGVLAFTLIGGTVLAKIRD